MKRATFILLVGFSAILSAATASDWPGFRGPNGDGIVEDASDLLLDWPADGLRLVWSVPLHDDGNATHAGPSISGERVFLPVRSGKNDVIVCLDAATGAEVWRYSYSAPGESSTYGTGIRAPPLVYNGNVYTLGCYGQLYCLACASGNVVWNADLIKDFNGKAPTFGMSAAPVVMNGLLICEPGGVGTSVVALDPLTGKPVWKSGGDEASYATPEKIVLDGVEQVLAYMSPGLISYDLKTGSELWRYAYLEERQKNIPQPVVSGDTIYVTNNTLGYAAVRVTHTGAHGDAAGGWTVKRVWSARKEKLHYSSPVIGDGCLYYQNSKRELHCLDLKSGELAWMEPDVGEQYGVVLRLGSHNLLTALEDGQLRVYDVSASAVHERSRFKACESAFVQPALAGGRLFVRDHEHVFCYEMRAAAYGRPTVNVAASTAASPTSNGPGPAQPGAGTSRSPRINWEWSKFAVSLLAALLLAIAGAWAYTRRQLPQSAVICGGAVLGTLLTMLVSAYVSLNHAGFWYSTKFSRLAPVVVGLMLGALMNFGGRFLSERSGLKSWRVWTSAAIVCAGIFAISRVQNSAIDLESVLLSTITRDTRSDLSLMKYTAIAAFVLALFVHRGLDRSPADGVTSIFALRLCAPLLIGLAVYAMGGIFSIAFLLAPVLFAAQWRRGPLFSLMIAIAAAASSTAAAWLLVQNTKYTFAILAAGIVALLCAVAVAVRKLMGTPISNNGAPVTATAPAQVASIPANAE